MIGALKKSISSLMDGDTTKRIAVTLNDGAGRFSGELVCIEDGVLTLAVESGDACGSLLSATVESILSVELVDSVPRTGDAVR